MHTPMFGGAPPPSCPRKKASEKRMEHLARYIISVSAPWNHANQPEFGLNASGLAAICSAWDSSSAPFVLRQRYRHIHNFIQKRVRSSENEKLCLEWRARNATRWNANPFDELGSTTRSKRARHIDPQADGVLAEDDDVLYWLTRAAALGNPAHHDSIETLQSTYWSIMGSPSDNGQEQRRSLNGSDLQAHICASTNYGQVNHCPPSLQSMSRRIQKMPPRILSPSASEATVDGNGRVNDPLAVPSLQPTESCSIASPEQQEIIDWVLTNLDKSDPVQTLTLMHGGAGTGKSFVIRKLQRELERRGMKTVITCPTGAAASQFAGGQTCHGAFKVGREGDHLSAAKLAELRLVFDSSVGLSVTDEVSMVGSEFAVKMDKRLRLVYRPDLPFGGKSVLWAGDFLQLEAFMGTPLFKALYKSNPNALLIHARDLLRRFRVFFLETQQRAHQCPTQQKLLDAFRELPPTYPQSHHGVEGFQPLNAEVVDTITHTLTAEEVERDPAWMSETTVLVTSNVDKAALTACAATLLAKISNTVVFRWKKPLPDVPEALCELLYNATDYPSLFGYFVKGGSSQILDNGNGNVEWGVGNGTFCRMVSLAWDDPEATENVLQHLETIRVHSGDVVDLPQPPDFINVQLVMPNGETIPATTWPPDNNLETEWVVGSDGSRLHKCSIVIPVGLIAHNQGKYTTKLARTLLPSTIELKYTQLAVELALVMTVWKAQGATLKRVLLFLEGVPGAPKWLFDHLYVGTSRVRFARLLRCLPLSAGFRKIMLKALQPNVNTTKWRMDIGQDGFWHPRSHDD